MSFFEIIDTFTFYGFDLAALSAVTCVVVQILKLTALKRCTRKVLTFLPFVIGVALYAIYISARQTDVAYVLTNCVDVLEHGFAVGSLSTLIYVCYEQFIREKDPTSRTEGVITTLIEGYVPTNEVERIAKQIALAIEKDVTGDGAKKTADILAESAEQMSERDVQLLAKLIIETLAHLNAH